MLVHHCLSSSAMKSGLHTRLPYHLVQWCCSSPRAIIALLISLSWNLHLPRTPSSVAFLGFILSGLAGRTKIIRTHSRRASGSFVGDATLTECAGSATVGKCELSGGGGFRIASLTFTYDPGFPGTEPCTNSKLFRPSTLYNHRECVVVFLLPMRPGSFLPGKTRPASMLPTEPGFLWTCVVP